MTQQTEPRPLYVLRRKADGRFMPDHKGLSGGTHVDPDKARTHTGLPRLFVSTTAAKNALRWWASGKVHVTWHYSTFDTDGDIDWHTNPVEGRDANDWEIIPVLLMELRS